MNVESSSRLYASDAKTKHTPVDFNSRIRFERFHLKDRLFRMFGRRNWQAPASIWFSSDVQPPKSMLRLPTAGVWRTLPRTALSRSTAARTPPSMSRSAWNSAPLRRSPAAKAAPRRTTPVVGDPAPDTNALSHRFRWLGIPVGGIAGLFGSLVGVGGGVIMVPMLTCRPLQLQVSRGKLPKKGARMCCFTNRLI